MDQIGGPEVREIDRKNQALPVLSLGRGETVPRDGGFLCKVRIGNVGVPFPVRLVPGSKGKPWHIFPGNAPRGPYRPVAEGECKDDCIRYGRLDSNAGGVKRIGNKAKFYLLQMRITLVSIGT